MPPDPLVLAENSIRAHEGLENHPYHDTRGFLTIGFGRNLSTVGLSPSEAEFLLRNDLARARRTVDSLFPDPLAGGPYRAAVLFELAYNLGPSGLASFTKLRQAFIARDFREAARQLVASRYAAQVGSRAWHLAAQLQENKPYASLS